MSCEKEATFSGREHKKPHTSILSLTGVLSHRRCQKNQTGVFAERTGKTDGQKERLPLMTRSLITLLRTDYNRTALVLSVCPSVRHLFRPIECFNLSQLLLECFHSVFLFFSKFLFFLNLRKASKVLVVEETVHPAAASWIHNLVL